MSKLTEIDFKDAAEKIGCDVATIRAVTAVESNGNGFDADGRIILRFEGHIFQRLTKGKFNKSNPNVSYPFSIQRSKPHGYSAFNEAFALDQNAAMESTSYGMFQPMGFNHELCGFETVAEMVDYLKQGERFQLLVFVEFVKRRGLVSALQTKNWAKFAFGYNGSAYRVNRYDVKLANFYKQFSR